MKETNHDRFLREIVYQNRADAYRDSQKFYDQFFLGETEMTKEDKKLLKVLLTGVTIFMIGIGSTAWYQSGIEKEVYERLTGNEVTQWEALWVNLRIDCN